MDWIRLRAGQISERRFECAVAFPNIGTNVLERWSAILNGRQTYMLLALTPGVIFTQEAFGASGFSGTRGWT